MTPQYSDVSPLSMTALVAAFGPNLEFGKDLSTMTSYRTGGRAKYFISATNADEISRGTQVARRLGIPCYIIGGGSNLLISDAGFDGLIIKVDVTGLRLTDPTTIECGAGEELSALVDFATQNGLTGLEFAAGIWGSVGGAIYGNAGAYGGEIGPIMKSAIIVSTEGVVKEIAPDYCRFAYRDSYLKVTHEVVVTARFGLAKGEKSAVESRVKEILASREQKHPSELTAGCFFKNIPDPKEPYGKLPAGRLLEQIGAKDLSVGGAKVYEKHANIIINTGRATSQDIRKLADIMKQRVK
ncbi:MAG: UDP-N-acetylmuramate dehydrogenase, partial [candidate division Zixibacteria bacterium]|nr:UDP-N-acetylmuramate dehydrogenase [candidate division Zixibacteria bacterium]